MPYDKGANVTRLFDRGIGVMISFFSSLLLSIIVDQPARVEITVIVFVSLVLWIMLDQLVRTWLYMSIMMKENIRWRDVIIEVLDFFLLLGIFLVAQLFMQGLREGMGTSEMGAAESIVMVLVVMLGGFAILHMIKEMNQQK